MDLPLSPRFDLDSDIALRAYTADDADTLFAVVTENLDHLHPFLHWAVPGQSRVDVDAFILRSEHAIEERTGLTLGIFDRGDLIGTIGFVQFNWPSRRCEIGYWIAKNAEGRGIITRATRLLTAYAFEDLGLNRVEVHCAAENVRSCAVPERLGFTTDGVLRQHEWRHTRFYDMVIYSMLRHEWNSQ